MSQSTDNIQWQCARLDDLSTAQQYAIFSARSEVFIIEQNCVYQDMDGVDLDSLHVIGWGGENKVAAYLRIVGPGIKFKEASLGRVITTTPYRGSGIGKTLIAQGIHHLQQVYPQQPIRIGAQAYLEKFYQSFGFQTVSDTYLEDDIPHIEMLRPAEA